MAHAEDMNPRNQPTEASSTNRAVRISESVEGQIGLDPATGLTHQIMNIDDVGIAPWRTLNTFSVHPAPFFDPAFLQSVQPFAGESPIRLLVVRDPKEGNGLKAIWPFRETRMGPAATLSASVTVTTHFSPIGIPIIARGNAKATIGTALKGFAERAPILVIPGLPLDSEIAALLREVMQDHELSHSVTGQADRAVLKGGMIFRDYVAKNWSRNRRNKIRRIHRRLEEQGKVCFRQVNAASPWNGAADAFLMLEDNGWKGRAGTSMAASRESRNVIETVIDRLIPAGLAEMHVLMQDDRPIAMLILMRLRGHVAAWKICYDEAWSEFSPGHLLFAEITQKIIARGDVVADSCSTDEGSLADAYWGERMPYGMMHIAVRPGATGTLGLGISAAQSSAFDIARSVYRRMRRGRVG